MPIECPRCLLTNDDGVLTCECGYDLVPRITQRRVAPTAEKPRMAVWSKEMRKRHFLIGSALIWLVLAAAEWQRLRRSLTGRDSVELAWDSLWIGLADLGGALVIGAVGWVGVWIARAYEERRLLLCPKRVSFGITVAAAALILFARITNPVIVAEQAIHGLVILAIAGVSYYAGCRGWLGKW